MHRRRDSIHGEGRTGDSMITPRLYWRTTHLDRGDAGGVERAVIGVGFVLAHSVQVVDCVAGHLLPPTQLLSSHTASHSLGTVKASNRHVCLLFLFRGPTFAISGHA